MLEGAKPIQHSSRLVLCEMSALKQSAVVCLTVLLLCPVLSPLCYDSTHRSCRERLGMRRKAGFDNLKQQEVPCLPPLPPSATNSASYNTGSQNTQSRNLPHSSSMTPDLDVAAAAADPRLSCSYVLATVQPGWQQQQQHCSMQPLLFQDLLELELDSAAAECAEGMDAMQQPGLPSSSNCTSVLFPDALQGDSSIDDDKKFEQLVECLMQEELQHCLEEQQQSNHHQQQQQHETPQPSAPAQDAQVLVLQGALMQTPKEKEPNSPQALHCRVPGKEGVVTAASCRADCPDMVAPVASAPAATAVLMTDSPGSITNSNMLMYVTPAAPTQQLPTDEQYLTASGCQLAVQQAAAAAADRTAAKRQQLLLQAKELLQEEMRLRQALRMELPLVPMMVDPRVIAARSSIELATSPRAAPVAAGAFLPPLPAAALQTSGLADQLARWCPPGGLQQVLGMPTGRQLPMQYAPGGALLHNTAGLQSAVQKQQQQQQPQAAAAAAAAMFGCPVRQRDEVFARMERLQVQVCMASSQLAQLQAMAEDLLPH